MLNWVLAKKVTCWTVSLVCARWNGREGHLKMNVIHPCFHGGRKMPAPAMLSPF